MVKSIESVMCPTCGRGYPAKFWPRTAPKPWRLGVKQDPSRYFKVMGEISGPEDLQDQAVFNVLRSRMLEGVANWVFKEWLDIREVLRRIADLRLWAGRLVWHQHVDIPGTLHRVEHSFSWGKAAEVEAARVGHSVGLVKG